MAPVPVWHSCVVCKKEKGKHKSLQFHRFPKDPSRCWQWLKQLNIPSLKRYTSKQLNSSHVVCSDHFTEDQYNNKLLLRSAIPTEALKPQSSDKETQMDVGEEEIGVNWSTALPRLVKRSIYCASSGKLKNTRSTKATSTRDGPQGTEVSEKNNGVNGPKSVHDPDLGITLIVQTDDEDEYDNEDIHEGLTTSSPDHHMFPTTNVDHTYSLSRVIDEESSHAQEELSDRLQFDFSTDTEMSDQTSQTTSVPPVRFDERLALQLEEELPQCHTTELEPLSATTLLQKPSTDTTKSHIMSEEPKRCTLSMSQSAFRNWKRSVTCWVHINKWSRKEALMFIKTHCVEPLQRTLDSKYSERLWQGFTVHEALNAIGNIACQTQPNKAIHWDKFFGLKQEPQEPVKMYASKCQLQAIHCDFKCPGCTIDLSEFMLIPRLISGLTNPILKRKVIQDYDKCSTLGDLIQKCSAYEAFAPNVSTRKQELKLVSEDAVSKLGGAEAILSDLNFGDVSVPCVLVEDTESNPSPEPDEERTDTEPESQTPKKPYKKCNNCGGRRKVASHGGASADQEHQHN